MRLLEDVKGETCGRVMGEGGEQGRTRRPERACHTAGSSLLGTSLASGVDEIWGAVDECRPTTAGPYIASGRD